MGLLYFRAWQLALEQARIPARSASAPPPYSYNAPPPYPGYYQNYQDGQSVVYYPGQTVYTAPGGYGKLMVSVGSRYFMQCSYW